MVVVHAWNSRTQGVSLRQEDHEIKASLSYTVRPCLKK
jgi:hypothetical protein